MVDPLQNGLPPYPWPQQPSAGYWQNCEPGGDTCLGAPGTPWVFKVSELRNRLLALGVGSSGLETALGVLDKANQYLRRFGGSCSGELDPNDPDPPVLYLAPDLGAPSVAVSVFRVSVHAALGSVEELQHVLHLRQKSGVTADTSTAGCNALAARVGAAWSTYWTATTGPAGSATSEYFHNQLSYDKILVSYVEYPGGNAKPNVITPTTQWNFSTPLAGTAADQMKWALPNEVALCLTLLTDQPGRRTRGRVYLGGLSMGIIAQDQSAAGAGLFHATKVHDIAERFGTHIIDGIHNDSAAEAEVNIVSRAGGSSRGVGGIRVGVVPDSQRRRRRNQNENKVLAWGTAS